MKWSYLIGPDALRPSEAPHTAAYFHIFMGGVHLLETGLYVGHHPPQHLPAKDHAGTPHTEVLSRL